MSDSQPVNPLEQLMALVSALDPIDLASRAVDASRRTTDSLLLILENFASTVDNLNRTTTRINSLLDEVEEPLRRIMPQVGGAINAAASLGKIAVTLGDLTKRLGPLTSLAESAGGLFGFKPHAARRATLFDHVLSIDRESQRERLAAAFTGERSGAEVLSMTHADGQILHVNTRLLPVREASGVVRELAIVCSDLTRQHQLEQQLLQA